MANNLNSLEDLIVLKPSVAKQYILYCLQAGLVPFVTGAPGIGKSQIIKEIAKEMNWKVIDHRLSTSDITDLNGLPTFTKKENGKTVASFAPFDIFPTNLDEIPKGYNGWLLFFDEFNSASEEVQAACYKIVLDRMIGQYKLNDNCVIVCAGNGKNDRAIVNDLSTAMVSRLVHIHMKVDLEDWLDNVANKQNYDIRIEGFIRANPTTLMNFDPEDENREGKPFCCPRSWEFVNRLLKLPNFKLDYETSSLIQGIISNDVAIQFTAFAMNSSNLATHDDIIKDPHTAMMPQSTELKYFMTVVVCDNFDINHIKDYEIYFSRMNDISMEVFFYRSVIRKFPQYVNDPLIQHKMSQIGQHVRDARKKRAYRGVA